MIWDKRQSITSFGGNRVGCEKKQDLNNFEWEIQTFAPRTFSFSKKHTERKDLSIQFGLDLTFKQSTFGSYETLIQISDFFSL